MSSAHPSQGERWDISVSNRPFLLSKQLDQTNRIRPVQVNRVVQCGLVCKSHDGLPAPRDKKRRPRRNGVVTHQVGRALPRVHLLGEGKDIDLVVVDGVSGHRVGDLPHRLLDRWDGQGELVQVGVSRVSMVSYLSRGARDIFGLLLGWIDSRQALPVFGECTRGEG